MSHLFLYKKEEIVLTPYLTKKELYQEIDAIRSRLPYIPKSLKVYQLQLQQMFSDLHIVQKELDSKKLSGMLLRSEISLIILNSSRNEISQRFTLTHEMIHYFLHKGTGQFFCQDDDFSPFEWQANEGAAELLVPYRLFLPLAARYHAILQTNRKFALRTLAQQFGVSLTIISYRLKSLSWELEQYENEVPLKEICLLSREKAACLRKQVFFPKQMPEKTFLDIFPE